MVTEMFSRGSYDVITTVYSLLFIGAFLLNGFVLLIFLGTSSLRTTPNLLLLSMAVADWLMAVLADSVGAYANANNWPSLGSGTCTYYGFITTTLGLTSMLHLTALTVERWVRVTLPMTQNLPERQMLAIIGFLWLFATAWSFFPVVGWSSYGPEPGFAACSIAWYVDTFNNKSYILCLFIFFFFLPVIIMAVCFSHIYISVRKLTKDAIGRWGSNSNSTRQSLEAERKTLRMSFAMVVAYLLAWTPYAVVSLYASFGSVSNIPLLVSTLPAIFAKTASCYNPVIYFFMYNRFRKAAKKMVTRNIVKPWDTFGSTSNGSSHDIPTSFPRVNLLTGIQTSSPQPLGAVNQQLSFGDLEG